MDENLLKLQKMIKMCVDHIWSIARGIHFT